MKDQPSHGSRGSPRRGAARKSSNKPSGVPKEKAKKSVNNYNYYLGSAKQASDYENTTQFLINYIQKTFDYGHDMSQALRELSYPNTDTWKPTLQFSMHVGTAPEDDARREAENKQYEIEFKSMFDSYMKRTNAFNNNKPKAYSFLWERCAKGMKNKIESRNDDDNDDDDDDDDLIDEMDPDEIAALGEPTNQQEDQDEEDVEDPHEDPEEEEDLQEEEQEANPNPAKQQNPDNVRITRTGRVIRPIDRLNLHQSHLQAKSKQEVPYSI